ncbi:MAG UNVERIFIED_CONTAM: alpha/beta hydrolase [Planctomycetaceae bacterium]
MKVSGRPAAQTLNATLHEMDYMSVSHTQRTVLRLAVTLFTGCLSLSPQSPTSAAPLQTSPPNDAQLIDLWSDLAPGETTREPGTPLPQRPEEQPPVTRITGITRPTLTLYPAKASITPARAVLILPGGGFRRVVVDKEGSEIAAWLNGLGISAFVLRYRTAENSTTKPWLAPLQDAQRAMAVIRSRAAEWQIDPNQVGISGFSAGGQAAARLLADGGQLAYSPTDDIDKISHRPDFALLVYPWNLWNPETEQLIPELQISASLPPVFLVHTHDDSASSLSAALFYAALRKHKVPAELHVFATGGHGYGLRNVPGSQIHTWPELAGHWLRGLPPLSVKK